MAKHLDLEEQEQLDQLKAFWARYGNLITWLLVIVLGAFAAWNGWNWWQREQAYKAGAMFDELEKAAAAADVDKTARVFGDMKDRFPRTAFTQQAALIAAKVQADKGQSDAAIGSLTWASEHAAEAEYKTMARLRLAGLLLDPQKYDQALKQLDGAAGKDFAALGGDPPG